jgi:hypothetical protein
MKRALVRAGVCMLASACTSVPPTPPTPARAVVSTDEHHDVSPPLRELPPASHPPDDMRHEIPIHRLPLPPGYRGAPDQGR